MAELLDLYGGEFELIDENLFNKFTEARPDNVDETQYNYCPDCKIPMTLAGSEYNCDMCGLTEQFAADGCKDHDETVSGSIRITTGSNKGRFYNITGDYTKTQKKFILDQLLQNQSNFTGMAFPMNVLNAAATQYNSIQKFITEDDIDIDGKVRGQKKFVRRGNIKDEVLAGLIYFECIREKLVRKKRDIAIFMKLPTYGFSRGEDILRNLVGEGKLDLPTEDEPICGYLDRYVEILGITNQSHLNFVIEIVEESEKRKIGMNSQISSKIVGALWILVTKLGLPITAIALEKACDNTKKNTFVKFQKTVLANMKVFEFIFRRYNIPYR
ncbi:Putative TFIIB [Pacmanvirus A23]|uniref:Putative TFIIB n=1 Tax=Pacmanvirus A23 TaxID=1932881 RepID=UPI000A093EFE|nr:Putative TFIIB [Pacmanvirus A23]SIP85835.1 Putative TFIIB [Pacmanvirus A23]